MIGKHSGFGSVPRARQAWFATVGVVGMLWLAPLPAHAHEQWFSPNDFRLQRDRPVSLTVRVGEGMCGEALPFQPERAVRFLAGAKRVFDLTPVAAAGDTVWARFAPSDDDGTMLGWESNFVNHQMKRAAFESYLVDEGLTGPSQSRRAGRDTTDGRERYRRCTKIWLTGAGGAALGAERATRPFGFALEIVPLEVPGAVAELPIRATFAGKPLAGVLVRVWRASFAEGLTPRFCAGPRGPAQVWSGHTDAEGRITVPCREPGQWLIGIVHMVQSTSLQDADWESTWASLGFARAAGSSAR